MIKSTKFWIILILSSLFILIISVVLWELILNELFLKDVDQNTIFYLYILRGIITSILLTIWVLWFIWKEKFSYWKEQLNIQKRFINIINNSSDVMVVYGENGNITTFNNEFKNLFKSINPNKSNILDFIPEANKENFCKLMTEVKNGTKIIDFETVKVDSNGEELPVSISLVYFIEGNKGNYIETIRNISERVHLRKKMIELEKTQIIGAMSEGIAHHLGTPLASMLLKLRRLKEDLEESSNDKYNEKIQSIEDKIFYCKTVLQRLLKFVRVTELEKNNLKLKNIFKDSIEIVKPLTEEHEIEIKSDINMDIIINGDQNLLTLVFSDLLINAIDAINNGGEILVSAEKDENKVTIKISDTGPGIEADHINKVFKPFYTTKPAGKGTGLGLTVAKSIINDLEGSIKLLNRKVCGLDVIITLPVPKEK